MILYSSSFLFKYTCQKFKLKHIETLKFAKKRKAVKDDIGRTNY